MSDTFKDKNKPEPHESAAKQIRDKRAIQEANAAIESWQEELEDQQKAQQAVVERGPRESYSQAHNKRHPSIQR